MIRAEFFESQGKWTGFSVKGHAGYAKSGHDIVCAAVSSAVMLTVNLITVAFGFDASVIAEGDVVKCIVSYPQENSEKLVEMLKSHLEIVSEEFPEKIKITTLEV